MLHAQQLAAASMSPEDGVFKVACMVRDAGFSFYVLQAPVSSGGWLDNGSSSKLSQALARLNLKYKVATKTCM
jgi:hypothetical protein